MANVYVVTAQTKSASHCQNFAIVVVLNKNDDDQTLTMIVVKIYLHQSNDVTAQEEIPTLVSPEAVAAFYDNTMYVAGIGDDDDEI